MADPLAVLREARFARLWAAVQRRLEADPEARSARLDGFSEIELQALCSLLGEEKPRRNGQTVRLADLDAALRGSAVQRGLVEVLPQLTGLPLRDRKAERAEQRAAQDALWTQAHARAGARLGGLLDALQASGQLTREASRGGDPGVLLTRLLALLDRLPSDGVLLQTLAAELTGSAHGLDEDRPLGRLGLRGAAYLLGMKEVPPGAAARRRIWAQVGVRCEELSSHALCHGLRPLGAGRLSRALNEASAAGEPARLTLRELRREPLRFSAETIVHVCENPAIVAEAADHLGERCAPLVCLEGMPSNAVLALLAQLRASNARIRFHCDFDEAGIRIGNQLHRGEPGAQPWRFGAEDYASALQESAELWPLAGLVPQAAWSPDLAALMSSERRAIYEEQVIAHLLADLKA